MPRIVYWRNSSLIFGSHREIRHLDQRTRRTLQERSVRRIQRRPRLWRAYSFGAAMVVTAILLIPTVTGSLAGAIVEQGLPRFALMSGVAISAVYGAGLLVCRRIARGALQDELAFWGTRPAHCFECGYDLRECHQRCSECGEPLTYHARRFESARAQGTAAG